MSLLPNEDEVLRIVVNTKRDKDNNVDLSWRYFDLFPHDVGCLSVDWLQMTTIDETIARVGAQWNPRKEDFKQYDNRAVFGLSVERIRTLKEKGIGIVDVFHSPLLNDPELFGVPNNASHSCIQFASHESDQVHICSKLREFAKDNPKEINWDNVNELVEKMRETHMALKK